VTRARWVLVVVGAALFFALQGGEYNTMEWLELRKREREERARIVVLGREVDSLTRLRKLVETDPATQERYARELYGMLREGEVEYTIVRPDDKEPGGR